MKHLASAIIFAAFIAAVPATAQEAPLEDLEAEEEVVDPKDAECIGENCCKTCKKGCACGDSCISCKKVCKKAKGCACNG